MATILLDIKDIKGQSLTDGYTDQIDILNYSWGVAQTSVDIKTSTAATAGQGQTMELTLTKEHDVASHALAKQCISGLPITQPIVLTHIRAAGEKANEFFIMTLTGVVMTSWTISGSDQTKPMETFSFAIGHWKFESKKQAADGSVSNAGDAQWNVKTSKSMGPS